MFITYWGSMELWLVGLFLFPVGLIVGSFSNVIRSRVPAGGSIVAPRSRCEVCEHHLRWYDLIPVISYLKLRGRCRYCTLPISPIDPIVELGAAQIVSVAGLMGGWAAGLTVILAWVVAVYGIALSQRQRLLRNESG